MHLLHNINILGTLHMIEVRVLLQALTCPFRRALTLQSNRVSASSAEDLDIGVVTAHSRPRRKARASPPAGKMAVSSPSHPMPSHASNGILGRSVNPITEPQITSALYADPKTTHFPLESVSNFERIVTPYNANEFDTLLHRYNLSSRYPTLPSDLRNGFPLGEFNARLLHSYNHSNHKNALPHLDKIFSYIEEEVTAGRMSGPFTWDELIKEAHGNVIVSPLGAVDKAGEPGKLRIIRDLSFKGSAPFSVNDMIDKDAFTTKWGTAASIIDLVCTIFFSSPPRPRWLSPSHDGYFFATMAVTPSVFVTCCNGNRLGIALLYPLHRVRVQELSSLHLR
jgi:hypothetical protein